MKLNRVVIAAILIILVMSVPAAGCISSSPIELAVMCSSVKQSGEPAVVTDNFTPDAKTIYCSVKLSGTSGKSIRAEWYIVKSDEAKLTNYFLGGETAKADSTYLVFSFSRASKLLPRGDYQVRLLMDNQQLLSVPFKVQGVAAAPSAVLSDATICSCIDMNTDEPLDRIAVVPDNATVVFCSVGVSNADFGTTIKARWIYIQGELLNTSNAVFAQNSSQVEGRSHIAFSVQPASGKKFPRGDYEVRLLVEDNEVLSVTFKVVDNAAVPGPYLSEAATFTASGPSDNQTFELTGTFPANIEAINYKVRINNAPLGTKLTIKWIANKSKEGDIIDYQMQEENVQVEGNMLRLNAIKRKSDAFPAGDYSIKFLLDGVEKISLPFKVQ